MIPHPPPLPPSLASHIDSLGEILQGSICMSVVMWFVLMTLFVGIADGLVKATGWRGWPILAAVAATVLAVGFFGFSYWIMVTG